MTRIDLARRFLTVSASLLLVAGFLFDLYFATTHPGQMSSDDLPNWTVVISEFYVALLALVFLAVGMAIIRGQPRHPVGWLFGLTGLIAAISFFEAAYYFWGDLPGTDWVVWARMVTLEPVLGVLGLALLLFPDGRAPTPRWRWWLRLNLLYIAAVPLLVAVAPWHVDGGPIEIENPLGLAWLPEVELATFEFLGVAFVLLGLVSVWFRWRKSSGVERQQIKWLGLLALVTAIELVLGVIYAAGLAPEVLGDPDVETTFGALIGDLIFGVSVAAIPVAVGLGVVRYRLYVVDRIISRTIVYGILGAAILAVYTTAVLFAGGLIISTAGASTLIGLVITAGIAVGFHPLRLTLQRVADRFVLGDRAQPYELMTRFGHELAQSVDVQKILGRIATAAGQAAGASATSVLVTHSDGRVIRAHWGRNRGERPFDLLIPIRDGEEVIGEIGVIDPSGRQADRRLLDQVAGVSTAAIRNVRILGDLEDLYDTIVSQNRELTESERRLRTAAEDERRRLGALVSGELDPLMSVLAHQIPRLRDKVRREPLEVAAGCRELVGTATAIVESIRSITRGVIPPILADHGLVPALRALVRRLDIDVRLHPERLGETRFPPAVEGAVYHCCRTMLNRVGAQAKIVLKLEDDDGCLGFDVTGDIDIADTEVVVMSDLLAALGGDLAVDEHSGLTRIRGRAWLTPDALVSIHPDFERF